MPKPWLVFCETADLATEVAAISAQLGVDVQTELSVSPLDAAARALQTNDVCVCLQLLPPTPAELVSAKTIAADRVGRLVLGIVSDGDGTTRGLSHDLGIACVVDVDPALAAAALIEAISDRPMKVQARKLSALNRARLERSFPFTDRAPHKLVSASPLLLGLESGSAEIVPLGRATSVRAALNAIQSAERLDESKIAIATSDRGSAREVLYGPPRLLSDPASKAALSPYGLPMPQEELCSSPSRASSEAVRIGFPVRISLASPDLRVWDHPDLSVDGVDNAARVRDVYRQLMLAAEEREKGARVLGVTVTATTLASALLRIEAKPLPEGHVLIRVSFADPHGIVARDVMQTVMPAGAGAITRALERLAAHELLLGGSPKEREARVQALALLFSQVSGFVNDFRVEVERIDLNPVALLVGGGAEVREAAVLVTDAFTRGIA